MPRLTSWDELMYEIYVRQTIEAGLADSDAGRTEPVEAVPAAAGFEFTLLDPAVAEFTSGSIAIVNGSESLNKNIQPPAATLQVEAVPAAAG